MYPQEEQEENDLFEGKDELQALQELLEKMGYPCDANTVISEEEDIAVCEGFIDDSDPCWRDNLKPERADC